MSATSDQGRLGTIAMAFLAGALGGAAAVSLATLTRPLPHDSDTSVTGLVEFDRHVRDLSQEMQALRSAFASRPPPEEPRTTPAMSLRADSSSDLAALIAKLDALLSQQGLVHKLGAAGGPPPLVIPEPTATKAARQTLIERGPEQVSSDCHLMTYQQIVERYGRPSYVGIDADGKIHWMYSDRDDPNRQVHFYFVDGLVSGWN